MFHTNYYSFTNLEVYSFDSTENKDVSNNTVQAGLILVVFKLSETNRMAAAKFSTKSRNPPGISFIEFRTVSLPVEYNKTGKQSL